MKIRNIVVGILTCMSMHGISVHAEDTLPGYNISKIPQCDVTNDTGQSIANNVYTTLTFNTVTFDNDSIFSKDTTELSSRLVAKTSGLYFIHGNVGVTTYPSSQGVFDLGILLTRPTPAWSGWVGFLSTQTSSYAVPCATVSATVRLNAGDYVQFMVNQNSGSTLTTNGSTGFTPGQSFGMVLLSR